MGAAAVPANRSNAQFGTLPQIIAPHLSNRDVEPVAQPLNQALEKLSLLFQGGCFRNVNLQDTDSYPDQNHFLGIRV